MSATNIPTEQQDNEPAPAALAAAESIAKSIFERNGNPETMTLTLREMTRVVAFGLDIGIKAAGSHWK